MSTLWIVMWYNKNVSEIGPLWNKRRITYCYDVSTVLFHFGIILSKYNFLIYIFDPIRRSVGSFFCLHEYSLDSDVI